MDNNKAIYLGTVYYQNLEEIKHILQNTIKVVYFNEAETRDTIVDTPGFQERRKTRVLKTELEDR